MGDRSKIVETETSGEYGEQVIVHGKTSGGVYKPIYIGDDGKVKIDPVPPDVNAIADSVWDEEITGHTDGIKTGAYLNVIYIYSNGTFDIVNHATYGNAALNTKILNIVNKDATPYPKVYPLLANAVIVTAGAGVWLEGSYIDIVPVNTISTPFWIYGVLFVGSNLSRYPLLTLASGSSGSETPFTQFTKVDFYEASNSILPFAIKIPAYTQIRAKVADNNAIATPYSVKLLYITGL